MVAVLAIIGVLAIILGILYLSGSLNSVHFLVGSVHKGDHWVRATVAFVVGVAFLAGAFLARPRSSQSSSSQGSSAPGSSAPGSSAPGSR
jgi:hypothetical protein